MLTLPLLSCEEVRELRALLDAADWEDGRLSAGDQAIQAKNNQQLRTGSEASHQAQALVRRALDRSPAFLAAALPRKVLPPRFNRYGGSANAYGAHVDGAVRYAEGGDPVRTDLSCTLFLSDPADYDGGELVLREAGVERAIKLPAGHAVLYAGSFVHEVRPVTRGQRVASFFWIQSLVRGSEQRRLLWEFDQALMSLRAQGESQATVALAGTYHNLLRMWAET